MSAAARRVPVSTPAADRTMRWAGLLSLCTVAAAGMACVTLGRGISGVLDGGGASPLGWLLLWMLLAAASEWLRITVEQRGSRELGDELQYRLVRRAFALGPARLSGDRSGALQTLMTQGVAKIAAYRQTYLGQLAGGLAAPLVAIALMAIFIDVRAALVMLLVVPLLPLLIGLFSAVTRKVSGGAREERVELAARYLDAIQGLETLTLTGTAPRMARRLAAAGERNRRATMRVLAANQLILFIIDAAFNLAFITAGVAVAAWRVGAGAVDAGGAAAIVALTILMLEPMSQVGGFFYVGMGGRANQSAYRAFLARPAPEAVPGRLDAAPAAPAPGSAGTSAPAVEVEGLRYTHPGADSPAVRDLHLRIGPGEHVAVTGRSGAGKSTLVNLLKGTLAAEAGTIRVGDLTVAPGDGAAIGRLRDASALVAQSTWLFTGTVRSNLAFARPDAPESELWRALAAARLDDEIRALPRGLDTPLGEGGAGLSGGQAQRLSLARALLSGRRLLLLDEPTSQVDLDSEARLLASIAALGRDRTVIMITHRATSLAGMDRTIEIHAPVDPQEPR